MAYEVTATRRRPQKFEDLVGQEFVVATLKNAIQSGKIAHAYLFSGPRGCGKTSSARILAKALNCQNGPSATPCEECTSCKEITKGSSLDVIEIDGASNNGVNDVRKIIDEILFPPNSGRYKIYIIDEVHMLTDSAFNALLKTIEEPPEYVIFIFATTELHKVPATIKSRCQQFHFRLGSVEQIKDLLAQAAAELGVQADDEALYWVARESTGSFRDAYTLFDQVVAFSNGHITYEKIRDKLGLIGVEVLNEICEYCVDGNSEQALSKFDTLLTNGISIEQFVSNFADYLRSLLLIESGIQKEALLGQSVERYSKKVLENWHLPMLERALSIFLNLYRDIRYSLSPRYECELAISKLSWLTNYVGNAELKNAIAQAKNLLLSTAAAGNTGSTGNGTTTMGGTNSAPQVSQNPYTQKTPPNPYTNPYSGGGSPNPFQTSGNQDASAMMAASSENTADDNSYFEEEVTRNNPDLSLDELKHEALTELSNKDKLSASIMFQTKNWSLEGNVIHCEVPSSYIMNQIESHAVSFSKLLSAIWGKEVSFVAKIEQKEQERPVEEELPNFIKALRDSVRGEVISITSNENANKTTEDAKKEEKPDSNTEEENSDTEEDNEFDIDNDE